MESVVGDISGAIQQLKNLSDVRLVECSDELTRGVVGGVVVSQCIQKFTFGTYFSKSTVLVNCLVHVLCVQCSYCMYCSCYDLCTSSGKYSEEVLKSLENIKNNRNLRDFSLILRELPSHYMASIVCGCFQSRTLEKLEILVEKVRVYILQVLSYSPIPSLLYCCIGYC